MVIFITDGRSAAGGRSLPSTVVLATWRFLPPSWIKKNGMRNERSERNGDDKSMGRP
jgi:hypothetical protein